MMTTDTHAPTTEDEWRAAYG
ncbi:MAG: hypothetical protein QOD24_1343, partial [Solirubrobacteraceae bacterium]|nr:hypothetical protein [Solirubrobacteraceae bacterium]